MYKDILVPLDGSKLAETVLPHVEAMVKAYKPNSVTFLRVVEPLRIPVSEGDGVVSVDESRQVESEQLVETKKYLDGVIGGIHWAGVTVKGEVLPPTGNIAGSITQYADNNKTDLIVITTHGRTGMLRWFMGSVAEMVARSANQPVLMVRVHGK